VARGDHAEAAVEHGAGGEGDGACFADGAAVGVDVEGQASILL
jgi:hypothetical protein